MKSKKINFIFPPIYTQFHQGFIYRIRKKKKHSMTKERNIYIIKFRVEFVKLINKKFFHIGDEKNEPSFQNLGTILFRRFFKSSSSLLPLFQTQRFLFGIEKHNMKSVIEVNCARL